MHTSNQIVTNDTDPVSGILHGVRPLLMGILNLTPDSFSDGGSYKTCTDAVDRAMSMIEEGADIIDIGGESTRPGSEPVDIDEERRRVMPVLERLSAKSSVPVSIDTTKSSIAREALTAGASIVNDISACRFDPEMAAVIAESGAYIVLMHMQGTPATMQIDPVYINVVEEVYRFLSDRVECLINEGIHPDRIIIDPGLGFGKTLAHNLQLLHNISRFCDIGYPVLVGASRKGMIGTVTGASVTERAFGTAAVVTHCIMNGVRIHRVHDVHAIRQVCDMAAAIRDEA